MNLSRQAQRVPELTGDANNDLKNLRKYLVEIFRAEGRSPILSALTVQGGISVNGATTLSGNATLKSNLSVAGTTTLSGSAVLKTTLKVEGATTLSATAVLQNLLDISGASAGQIKFPASQNASADANTLDDYEEGTWTPADGSGAGLSFTTPAGVYRKAGSFVWVSGALTYPATASGAQAVISGLPFTPAAGNENRTGVLSYTTSATPNKWLLDGGATSGSFFQAAGGGVTNANMTGSFNAINAGYVV